MTPEELAKKLLAEEKYCVLATSSKDGLPQAALMEFCATDELGILFETFVNYRKYANLRGNPKASVVVSKVPHTLQMDGTMRELVGPEVQEAKRVMRAKYGEDKQHYEDPRIRFFQFTTTWARILYEPAWPPKYAVLRG